MASAGIHPGALEAVAITSQAQTFTVRSAGGEARLPFVSWRDTRCEGRNRAAVALPDFARHSSLDQCLALLMVAKLGSVEALAMSPDYAKGRYDLIRILITLGRWDAADGHADVLLAKYPDHEGYLNTKGLISLYRHKYDEAIAFFQKSLSKAPFFKTSWIGLGIAYSLNGNYTIAENILRRAHQIPPKDMLALLGLIENSRSAEDMLQAGIYADMLLTIYDSAAIRDQLHHLSNNHLLPPLSPEFISEIIESRLKENS